MRTTHPARSLSHRLHAAHSYPTCSDRHPLFLFGHFDLGGTGPAPGFGLDEVILGIREDPQSTECGRLGHSLLHTLITAQECRRFMFGVDPEQPRAVACGEPSLYFWGADGPGPREQYAKH